MPKTPIDLAAAADSFLSHCERARGLSANTLRAYAQDLSDFIGFAGARTPVGSIDGATILAFVDDLRIRRGRKPRTIRRRIACLKAFFKCLQRSKSIGRSPFADLDLSVPIPRGLPRTLSLQEFERLARTSLGCPENERVQPAPASLSDTTHLAVLLLCATGMRVGEITSLTLRDVDADRGTIRILGKGNRERTAFVTEPRVLQTLRRYLYIREQAQSSELALLLNRYGAPLTAQALRLRLQRLGDRAGLSRRLTPHVLRHTAATLLLDAGVDIRFVQRLLGHRSITTTEIYTHVSDESLRRTLERAQHLGEAELSV